MKVLFIGGTGIISTSCSKLAIQQGMELHLLNRGSGGRTIPEGAHVHRADIRNSAEVQASLGNHEFDAVVEWVGYEPAHIKSDVKLFEGRTGQYIFISSASAYQKPPQHFPIIESTTLINPFWLYSQDKIACENILWEAYHDRNFPVTIVRPSHTYDQTYIPLPGRYTIVDRMRKGKKVIVQGDGTSIWTLTHSRDFAVGFNGLLGLKAAIGQDFHITSDHWLTWNNIYQLVGEAAGAVPEIVHIPSDFIASIDTDLGANMLGDKSHSAIFDNSKIRSFVPEFNPEITFHQGITETIAWHDAEPARQLIDQSMNVLIDNIIESYLGKAQ